MEPTNNKKAIVWITVVIVALVVIAVVLVVKNNQSEQPVVQNTQPTLPAPLTEGQLQNATYSFYGDTFTLSSGSITLRGHSDNATSSVLVPMSYTYAATSSAGDITGTGQQGNIVALYRGFGANLQWVTLFAMADTDGNPSQIASGVAYEGDSQVQSIGVSNGVITLNLLVVSQADQKNLPHYKQVPNSPLVLQFQIVNGQFVSLTSASSTNANAGSGS